MATLLDDIPGLKERVAEAARKEGELRVLPFLDVTLDICGVPVKQFTPRHWAYLDAAGVPFFAAEAMSAVQVAQFLWIVSPSFRVGDAAAREAFLESIVQVPFGDATAAIAEYVDFALLDRPETGGQVSSAPITSYLAAIVDRIAEGGYTWSRDQILDTPFAE